MKLYGVKGEESRRFFGGGEVTVAVYGLGKMGLPLAAVFADSGASVVGVDINGGVVDSVNDGINHVREEPGLDELVSRNVGVGRLRATSDFVGAAKESDIQVILVPTLIRGGEADLSPVYSVAECISGGLEGGDIVVTECTMPPGSTESLIPILEKSGLEAGVDFGLGHCPERTMSGTAIRDIRGQYPKVIGCVDGGTTGALEGVYSAVNSKGVVSVSGIRAAECVKVFEGVYRDVNIALANELTAVCERLGVDAVEVFRVANTQPYCSLHSPGGLGVIVFLFTRIL
ncbi:MAG: nucleotide sugar dehydrogenase [Candidatus Altiarchaeales archaeon]|nr:nucleotide sugar dehydrogenase [Candidatus Altiarchaeales archaeon]